MSDAERFDALQDAGRQAPAVCTLCGRDTEGACAGPCCDACELEQTTEAARLAESEWLEKWGADEADDNGEEAAE